MINNSLSLHVNIPHFLQRTYGIPSAITMNYVLDDANMYHRMNSVLKNNATLFPQRYVIDVNAITNHSDRSVEGCVAQQPREPLASVIVERNGSVELNGHQLENGSLKNLDEAGRHQTNEIISFHEHVDRNATTRNKDCIVGEATIEMHERC